MKTIFFLCLGILFLIVAAWLAFHYHYCISRGICPVCGAPIEKIKDGPYVEHRCTECDWYEILDEHGNDIENA